MAGDTIPEIDVFKNLTRDELQRIASYCQRLLFEKGQIIISAGQMVSAFYILVRGQLKVFLPRDVEGKKELRTSDITLNTLNEGDCFGEYSLIDKRPASASIIATRRTELARISEADFNRILREDAYIARTIYLNMLRILIKRLREKDREYEEVYDKLDSKSGAMLRWFTPFVF